MDRLTQTMSKFCDLDRDKRFKKNYAMERDWVKLIMEEAGLHCNFMDGYGDGPEVRLSLRTAFGQIEKTIDLNGNIEDDVNQFVNRYKDMIDKAEFALRLQFGQYKKYFCALPLCKAHMLLDTVSSKRIRLLEDDGSITERNRVRVMMKSEDMYIPVWFCEPCSYQIVEATKIS